MTEVFTINGETLESVQQAIAEYKNKILGGASTTQTPKENSLRDVDVEVLSYKSYKDNALGEIPTSTQVITTGITRVVSISPVIIHRIVSFARGWFKDVT